MKKIEKLTQEQASKLQEYAERWTRIGLCTDPADRPEAEAAINESYRAAGLKPPRKIVWCGSPLSQGLTRAIVVQHGGELGTSVGSSVRTSIRTSVRTSIRTSIRNSVGNSVWDSVRNSVWSSVRNSVWASIGDSVWDSVWNSVRSGVGTSIGTSIGNSVRNSVRNSVWDSVRNSVYSVRYSVWDSVGNSVWASVRYSIGNSVYGAHDANWLAFYAYMTEVLGLREQTEKLQGLTRLCKAAGWALPHQNICWVSERHSLLQRDDAGRLHSLTGPSVLYPDGWAIYAVHGVLVPSEWITESNKLDPITALTWENVEQRRAAAEIIGWDRILQQLQPVTVNTDPDPQIGTLLRVDLPDAPGSQFLRVRCGTGRDFCLPVPEDIRTAIGAQEWMWNLKPGDYLPEVRT